VIGVSIAVEGPVDEAIARRLVAEAGGLPARVFIAGGKSALVQKLPGYNAAARRSLWLVVLDLDRDASCVSDHVRELLPHPAPGMCLRVAVRAAEAWLLADRGALARALAVRANRVPANPERLDDPKSALVDLARHSSNNLVRADIVPSRASGRRVGPAYTGRLIEFVENRWRPDAASDTSESLRRARKAIRSLVAGGVEVS
jgi:hypothetical protein